MIWNVKRELVPLGILIAVVVLAFIYGPGLPDQVPSHFDANGYPDDTMPRTVFLVLIPGIVAGLYLFLTFIPFVDPLWKKIQPRYNVLLLLRDFTMGFMLMMFVMNLIAVREGRLAATQTNFVNDRRLDVTGNYLPKTPRNWFFGIRSPWTMSSDEVWRRSHIVGGWWFVGAGLLIAVLSIAGVSTQYLLPAVLIPTVIVTAFVYPYLLFRRLQRTGRADEPGDADQMK